MPRTTGVGSALVAGLPDSVPFGPVVPLGVPVPVGVVGVEEFAGVEASGVDDDDDAVDEDVEPSTATVEEDR